METQKIANLLNNFSKQSSKFATKKWYIIDGESKVNYIPDNEVTFLTSSLESSLEIEGDAESSLETEGDADLTVNTQHIPNHSSLFKYKSSFITKRNGAKIAVPLKYLSNFQRS